jgi:DNA-binding transcriptional LysR family regulator
MAATAIATTVAHVLIQAEAVPTIGKFLPYRTTGVVNARERVRLSCWQKDVSMLINVRAKLLNRILAAFINARQERPSRMGICKKVIHWKLQVSRGVRILAFKNTERVSRILPPLGVEKKRFIESAISDKNSTMNRISLNALRVFEAAARRQSFMRAADELHVTPGAISRQIRVLEDQLGVALFERHSRAVFLTDAGRALLVATSQALALVEHAVERIQREKAKNVLVLSCEPTIAMKWLIPRLSSFHAEHPDVLLHLMTAGGPIDFAQTGVDVALRRNDFRWDIGLHAEHVCDEYVGPICSPDAARRGDDLKEAARLSTKSRPDAWSRWYETSGRQWLPAREALYEHFYLSIKAAAANLGVALASALMVDQDIAEGRLTAPFGFTRDGSAYYLLAPARLRDDPRINKLLWWLRGELAQTLTGAVQEQKKAIQSD